MNANQAQSHRINNSTQQVFFWNLSQTFFTPVCNNVWNRLLITALSVMPEVLPGEGYMRIHPILEYNLRVTWGYIPMKTPSVWYEWAPPSNIVQKKQTIECIVCSLTCKWGRIKYQISFACMIYLQKDTKKILYYMPLKKATQLGSRDREEWESSHTGGGVPWRSPSGSAVPGTHPWSKCHPDCLPGEGEQGFRQHHKGGGSHHSMTLSVRWGRKRLTRWLWSSLMYLKLEK